MDRKRLIDVSNALYGLSDELWPLQAELQELCPSAAVEVRQARDSIEQAMVEIKDKEWMTLLEEVQQNTE